MDNQSPLGDLLKKTVQFHGELFTSNFLQAAVAGPVLGIDFLRKFKVTVAPETSQILFAPLQQLRPPPNLFCLVLTVLFRRLFSAPSLHLCLHH
jgi:hypothetical protein